MHVSVHPKAFGNQQQATCHESCTVWANKCLVCTDVHPPLPPWGGEPSIGGNPPWDGTGTVVPWGGIDKGLGRYLRFLRTFNE